MTQASNNLTTDSCCCTAPPFHYSNFDSIYIGVDETQGRFGEVSIKTCKICSKKWLYYYLENEAFCESGRWYQGLISQQVAESVTPKTALAILQSLDWYFYGGSYFQTAGRKGSGLINKDF